MPIPFIMPKMDMDQENVTIIEWMKKEGDQIQKGEPVILIETDKITSEVEAPATGQLVGLLYQENDVAPVTKVVAYILKEGESEADLPKVAKSEEHIHDKETQPNKDEPPEKGNASNLEAGAFSGDLANIKSRVKTPATPLASRIARAEAVNIDHIKGSGPRGRVQAADVRAFLEKDSKEIIKSGRTSLSGKTIDVSIMRQRIAERLTESYQTIPHIYQTVEVDMSLFEDNRRILNENAEKENQPKISLTACLVKTIAICLKHHPYLNASLDGEKISFWNEINIGIATALENGLIVPVIHNADQLTILETNRHMKALTARAQAGKLEHHDIQNGTFTISNMGMYGIHSFTSIINPPQSAILSVGAIKRRPVVVDDEDSINVRSIMMLTLAADHRIVDGAVAANFLLELVNKLENSELLSI